VIIVQEDTFSFRSIIIHSG